MPATGTPSTSISIATPANWVGVDLGTAFQDGATADQLHRLLDAAPDRQTDAERLLSMMRDGAARSVDAGVSYAAALVEFPGGVPLLAALTVMVAAAPGLPTDRSFPPSTADVADILRRTEETTDRDADVAMIDLHAGTAVRVRSLGRFPIDRPGEGEMVTISDRYYVPVPGRPDQIVVLNFISPSVAFDMALRRLFDAIARTLEFS